LKKHRILITGGTGLLGKALLLTSPEVEKIGITHLHDISSVTFNKPIETYKVDLGDSDTLIKAIHDFKPTIVIHTAGMGSVDEAEKNQNLAKKLNLDILNPLINSSNKIDASLVFISSNAVYDGENPPYREDSIQKSVNYYGELKILSEKYVKENAKKYIIIRPILMYGWPEEGRRDNPFSWIHKKLSQKEPLKLVNDTVTMPLLDRDCALVCWKSLDFLGHEFNIAGSEQTTFYDFGKVIAEEFGFDSELLSPVGSDAFPTIAKRPKDTSFDISKVRKLLGINPVGIREGTRYLKGTRTH